MSTVEQGLRSQTQNIEATYGRPIDAWIDLIGASGRTRHGEIVAMLKASPDENGLGSAGLAAHGVGTPFIVGPRTGLNGRARRKWPARPERGEMKGRATE
jgi:hypothetical protein